MKPQDSRNPLCRIAHVVLLHEIGVIAEHRDGRRRDLDLRRVVQLDLAARGLRRLAAREQLAEPLVHLRRRDALAPLRLDLER